MSETEWSQQARNALARISELVTSPPHQDTAKVGSNVILTQVNYFQSRPLNTEQDLEEYLQSFVGPDNKSTLIAPPKEVVYFFDSRFAFLYLWTLNERALGLAVSDTLHWLSEQIQVPAFQNATVEAHQSSFAFWHFWSWRDLNERLDSTWCHQ